MSDLEDFDHVFGIRGEEDLIESTKEFNWKNRRIGTKITEVVLSLRILGNFLPILRKRRLSCMTTVLRQALATSNWPVKKPRLTNGHKVARHESRFGGATECCPDNARAHSAAVTRDFLRRNEIKVHLLREKLELCNKDGEHATVVHLEIHRDMQGRVNL
ncbi:hypothetical protein L9F63_017733, partial [Diploptera punctata]